MRVVIQRVNHAQVDIDGKTVGKIGKGFLLLVGIKNGDEFLSLMSAIRLSVGLMGAHPSRFRRTLSIIRL